MEKVDQLWQERRGEFWTTASRYLKLLGNSGFMFVLYILILAGGVYYQRWVSSLSDSFPTEWILTVLFALLVFRTPMRTFLKSADLVFLLPLEKQMDGYFKKSIIYNTVLQCIEIVFVWAIVMPLYLHTISPNVMNDVILLVLLLVLKAWNADTVWQEYHILNSGFYDVLRSVCTLIFIAAILFKMPWWMLITIIVVMLILTLYVFHPLSKHLLKWEKLLRSEERQMEQFYRLANMITDVPQIRQRMKPRRFLTGLTELYPYGKTAVFKKFFLKTFFRSGEYFGIWLRLVIIGIIVIALLPKGLISAILAIAFTYLTAIQLMAIWKEHLIGPTTMFSLPSKFIKSGFLSVFTSVLAAQIVIYGLAVLAVSGNLSIAGLTILSGLILCFGFTYGFVSTRLKN